MGVEDVLRKRISVINRNSPRAPVASPAIVPIVLAAFRLRLRAFIQNEVVPFWCDVDEQATGLRCYFDVCDFGCWLRHPAAPKVPPEVPLAAPTIDFPTPPVVKQK